MPTETRAREQIVILAGGKGTRLGELTAHTPKPLLEIAGRPFLTHLIVMAVSQGFARFVILCGPFEEQFRAVVGDGHSLGATEILFVPEPTPAGTGGALTYATDFIDSHFLLMNGDSYFAINLKDVPPQTPSLCLCAMALRAVKDTSRYGKVTLHQGLVDTFGEKNTSGEGLINAGVYWLNKAILSEIRSTPSSLETDILPDLVSRQLVRGRVHDADFIDIGTPDDFARAHAFLRQHSDAVSD